MCGIIATLLRQNSKSSVNEILINGLTQLQNRGYDSAGFSYVDENGKITTTKFASDNNKTAIQKLVEHGEIPSNTAVGIAHTRWATHGAKNDTNSHPHNSNDNKISIVHNGIIENYAEIKEFLSKTGFVFHSQTDSEVIANFISYFYNNYKFDMEESIRKTINKLEGTYGLAILNSDIPNKLYCVANGSPILVGKTDDYCIVASESTGFCNYLKTYITLKKDDVMTICFNEKNVLELTTHNEYEAKKIVNQNIVLTPSPYPHWTLKEIYEQPLVIKNSLNHGGRILDSSSVKLGGLDECRSLLEDVEHLIMLGCGTSENAALYSSHIFKSICNFATVQVINGSEFGEKDIPRYGKTIAIFISQSGETKDLHRCLEIVKSKSVISIGVINVVDSLIAREVDCGVYCNAGREVAVASTKSFTSQVVCLNLIALWFSKLHVGSASKRIRIIKDLNQLSYDFENTLKHIDQQINTIAKDFSKYNNVFILGKECDEAVAREGALKIKEISYIHAEGCSATALKHGPFALLDENMPVILIDNDHFQSKIINTFEEVSSRHSPIYFISSNSTMESKTTVLKVSKNATFQSLLNIIPLQLLAYYASIEKGINPDTPKNLAKVVTVE